MTTNSVQRYAGECVRCGETLSGHADVTGELNEPNIGDAAVCLYCGEVMFFTLGFGLRLATADEIAAVESDSPMIRALRQWRGRHGE